MDTNPKRIKKDAFSKGCGYVWTLSEIKEYIKEYIDHQVLVKINNDERRMFPLHHVSNHFTIYPGFFIRSIFAFLLAA